MYSSKYLHLVDAVLKTLLSVTFPVPSVWLLSIARSQNQQLLVLAGTTTILNLCLTLLTAGEGLGCLYQHDALCVVSGSAHGWEGGFVNEVLCEAEKAR